MPSLNIPVFQAFNLYEAAGKGLVSTLYRIGSDFLAGENKPWYYYVGVLGGSTVVGTGIPGAIAALTATAHYLDVQVQKNPDGGEIQILVDGAQQGIIDSVAATAIWDTVRVNLWPTGAPAGGARKVEFVSNAVAPAAFAWMALGDVTLFREDEDPEYVERTLLPMPYVTLAVRIRDSESDTREATVPLYLPVGKTLAEYQAYANAVLPEIDFMTEGKITSAEITLPLTLPAGLKANPEDGSINERGGLITFDTTGPRADSVRIPAIARSIMTGNSFSLSHSSVADFILRLTTATTTANIRPRTSQDYEYSAARKGAKSFRK